MLEVNSKLREIYLEPGELHIAGDPVIILTALGACIGITFWTPKLRVGALAHPLLPYSPTDTAAEKRLFTGRQYVDFSIRQLAWQFDHLDVSRGDVQVKVFGGAEVLGVGGAAKAAIGKLNSEAAIEVLEAEGFKIIASSLGVIGAGRSTITSSARGFPRHRSATSPVPVWNWICRLDE